MHCRCLHGVELVNTHRYTLYHLSVTILSHGHVNLGQNFTLDHVTLDVFVVGLYRVSGKS